MVSAVLINHIFTLLKKDSSDLKTFDENEGEKLTMTISGFQCFWENYHDWIKALPNYGDIWHSDRHNSLQRTAQIDVLDLGAGTGLFSTHVQTESPGHFVLYDLADK